MTFCFPMFSLVLTSQALTSPWSSDASVTPISAGFVEVRKAAKMARIGGLEQRESQSLESLGQNNESEHVRTVLF